MRRDHRALSQFRAETDEGGPRDYKEGTTVALSLEF